MPFSIAGPVSPAKPSLDGINRIAQRISSGISVEFRDNAAEAAVSGRLDTVQGETTVSVRNITDQISAAQKADDTLGYVAGLVERIQSFEVQLGNGALSNSDRNAIRQQISNDSAAAKDALKDAKFNGASLFDTQAGKELSAKLNEPSPDYANIQETVGGLRAELGAEQNGLEAQADQLLSQQVIDGERQSRLQDTDYGSELANLVKEELLFRAQVSAFNHQKVAEASILGLLSQ